MTLNDQALVEEVLRNAPPEQPSKSPIKINLNLSYPKLIALFLIFGIFMWGVGKTSICLDKSRVSCAITMVGSWFKQFEAPEVFTGSGGIDDDDEEEEKICTTLQCQKAERDGECSGVGCNDVDYPGFFN